MDDPIFPKNEWCLTNEQEELCNLAKDLGFKKFSKRAFKYDREGSFPVENYRDLADRGLLGICVPKKIWWPWGRLKILYVSCYRDR